MTPPIIWYTDHDGIAVPTESPPPGAVPYMLARPMPIETAPRDGRGFWAWWPAAEGWLKTHRYPSGDAGRWSTTVACLGNPTHWLPLPPAPEGA